MSLIEKKEKYFPLQSCIIFIIIAIIIIAIICRGNWKCRKSASCCIREEIGRGKTAASTVSFVNAAATPCRRPLPHPIATSFRTHTHTPWLNTSGTHFISFLIGQRGLKAALHLRFDPQPILMYPLVASVQFQYSALIPINPRAGELTSDRLKAPSLQTARASLIASSS